MEEEDNPFERELAELINKYSLENGSNTPDYILANYLVCCLNNFDIAVGNRDMWGSVPDLGITTPTTESEQV